MRSHRALLIRVYNTAGNVIETHEHAGDFKERLAYAETKSRHAVKHDGSLPRLVDRFQRLLRAVCGAVCSVEAVRSLFCRPAVVCLNLFLLACDGRFLHVFKVVR